MENYKLKEKILKTKPVTYYRAIHSISNESYIVKKLNRSMTWEQVLESKSMTLCKNTKCKYIAKIKEIIKEENSFYCIMENSEQNLTDVIKNDINKKDIFKIAKQLIELTTGLYEEKLLIRDIRPSHLFVSKNSLKLYHFETVSEKDLTELDMTEQQDMRYTPPEEVLTKKGSNEKSMMFTIGLVIAEVILGEPLINAKNKLEYIYQLTHLFPNERMDKMKGSEHEFKELEPNKNQTFVEKMQQSDIGPSLISLLGQMLKIDHSERISMNEVAEALNIAIESEETFHKNKDEAQRENNLVDLPHKNQVNIENETVYEIEFDFENKPTLSSIPLIFNQKNKQSSLLPPEKNVEDDGNQPIIIKQASSAKRGKEVENKIVSRKSFTQKISPSPKAVEKLNIYSNTKPTSIPSLRRSESPSVVLNNNISQISNLPNLNKNNEMLKNSKTSKQTTTLNTIKRPQLTNYAMNEANLGIKVGISNTLFSENNYDEEEYL